MAELARLESLADLAKPNGQMGVVQIHFFVTPLKPIRGRVCACAVGLPSAYPKDPADRKCCKRSGDLRGQESDGFQLGFDEPILRAIYGSTDVVGGVATLANGSGLAGL